MYPQELCSYFSRRLIGNNMSKGPQRSEIICHTEGTDTLYGNHVAESIVSILSIQKIPPKF